MPEHRDPTACLLHDSIAEALSEIKGDLKTILARLGKGDVSLATIEERVRRLEHLVYGGVAVVLTAVAIAVIALLIRP